MKVLTLEERFEWFRNNPPKYFDVEKAANEFITWDFMFKSFKQDMYSFVFNHPYYCGPLIYEDDELRHLLLDDHDVPREI
jgi:hypothetical protein